MKAHTVICMLVTIVLVCRSNSFSETGNGVPLKYISSCELDFNNDNEPDIALLVETLKYRELIVLMRAADGYDAFVVSKKPFSKGSIVAVHLSCHFGKFIKETEAGKRKNEEAKIFETPGTYFQLFLPEHSSAAYFWNGSGFTEVWTAG